MANKITVLLDLVTDKATSAAKGFKSSIADAEGAANKFKAGASSAFATVQANAGAFALGAGSALAAFGAITTCVLRQLILGQPISATTRMPFGLFFAPAIWICWVIEMRWFQLV